jgi:hypothetical protein
MNIELIQPVFAESSIEWTSTIVAVALILFLAIIMVIALTRYTIDEVLKLWAGLGTIVGILTGTFGTYFFTRQSAEAKVQAAQAKVEKAQVETRLAETQLKTFKSISIETLKDKIPPSDVQWLADLYKKDDSVGHP